MNNIKIEGIDDLVLTLDSMGPKHARNLMRSTIHSIAGIVAKKAKKNAEEIKDSGTLIKSIKTKRRRGTPTAPISDVIVLKEAFYWRYKEHGTISQDEKPFFRYAVEDVRSNFVELVTEQFGKKLEKALARKKRSK